ncbi:C40 family peptidase [Lactobacillus crispatus]|uniref:NlpC/P60 family protein n=2 Tax=Lactobacillus crispatus TaxID=47770 RepID=A0AAW8WVI2_9LACO|nr:C40 family peptidase [Lactobacillus crispatus]STX18322.1 NlpC/P60 family protein [Lactobacillus acidophilus]MCT7696897.1 NlpC/P60 family protein [Lactobacillus crispatus]MCT7708362.1 NlpC/P60 family protein [Lactobacillus crispatus]MCT7731000.1 NlpC/P60 family protein [Lactobacillus crispatus]MCT7807601.1 NlpC/P60 family protein [Lactobacillus crispatus]
MAPVVAHADTVQVKSGDTLQSIAQEHHMTTEELAKANNLNVNSALTPNQNINVPNIPKTYIVKEGDTVSEIAKKYGLKTKDVLNLNHLNWQSTILIGQKLKLTDNKTASTVSKSAVAPNNNSVSGNSVAARAVNLALQLTQQNIPYVWGGNSTGGMDCSGMVQYVYAQLGISLPHNTVQQEAYVNEKPVSQAQPGDLLFWGQPGASYHVAIYIGGDKFVAAPAPGQNVSVGSISAFPPSFSGSLK